MTNKKKKNEYIISSTPENIFAHSLLNTQDKNNILLTKNWSTYSSTSTKLSISKSIAKSDSSLYFNGDDFLATDYSDDMVLETKDFTIDFWEYPIQLKYAMLEFTTTNSAYGGMCLHPANSSMNSILIILDWGYSRSTRIQPNTGCTYFLNQWTHRAITRSGNNIYVFQNGKKMFSVEYKNVIVNGTQFIVGGTFYVPSTYFWRGYLDNFRFVVGHCYWIEDFDINSL